MNGNKNKNSWNKQRTMLDCEIAASLNRTIKIINIFDEQRLLDALIGRCLSDQLWSLASLDVINVEQIYCFFELNTTERNIIGMNCTAFVHDAMDGKQRATRDPMVLIGNQKQAHRC